MVWVRSEYAGELAVLSAWLAALLPWNITYSPNVLGGRFFFVRFPFFQLQYGWGVNVDGLNGAAFSTVAEAIELQSGQTLQTAYYVWSAGAAVIALALALSVVYYAREERVEAGPVDPVRLMGALLLLAGLLLTAANYLVVVRGIPGIPLPVGAVVLLALGVALVRVERRDSQASDGFKSSRT